MTVQDDKTLKRYAARVGYSEAEVEQFGPDDPRRRLIERLAQAAARYSIVAEVTQARHCNSGYRVGDKFVLDVAGNFLADLCPRRLCVYLVAQLALPVALINERLSEGLDPNLFHFMHQVRCPDAGVDCGGYGAVTLAIKAVPPRIKAM